MKHTNRTIALIAAAGMTALAACTQKDSAKTDTTATVAQSGGAASGTSAARGKFDLATHTATIYAKDYAFDAPDTISAGITNFQLVNDGPGLHHVQLVRLDSGKTAQDLQAALKNPGPPPRWAVFVGGPNAPDPKGTSNATLDLQPGNYVILCLVDIPDHVPHFAKGMFKPFTVTAAAGTPATAPAADVTVGLADYAFTVKGALTAGKHTIKVENSGPQPHEIEIVRLAPGKTMKDLASWMDKPNGPPPANAIGGVDAIAPGITAYSTVDLTPGNYLMLCLIPDGKDGKPHVEHGMMKEFKVN